jgi:hypothetical protein
MTKPARATRALTATLFSLIMGVVLAFGGDLLGMYLWDGFGRGGGHPDDVGELWFGCLVGGVVGLVGGTTLLWKFWPRRIPAEKKEG